MPEKSENAKKEKQILLRKRPPEIVKRHRQLRNRRWGAQAKAAARYLSGLHGVVQYEVEDVPEVIELVRTKHETSPPVFHGTPRHYLSGLTDLNFTINGQCRGEPHVASRWTIRGVHSGELLGAPPTGREVIFTGVTLTLLEGEDIDLGEDGYTTEVGKVIRSQWAYWIVEEWNFWDVPGLVAQIREGRQAVSGRV
jgi:predicted ester cyclase